MGDRVVDRRDTFAWFYHGVYDKFAHHLGATGWALYTALCRHANVERTCFPSQVKLAERFGISRKTVNAKMKELESYGLIKITSQFDESGRKTANLYEIIPLSEIPEPEAEKDESPAKQDVTSQHMHVTSEHMGDEGVCNLTTHTYVSSGYIKKKQEEEETNNKKLRARAPTGVSAHAREGNGTIPSSPSLSAKKTSLSRKPTASPPASESEPSAQKKKKVSAGSTPTLELVGHETPVASDEEAGRILRCVTELERAPRFPIGHGEAIVWLTELAEEFPELNHFEVCRDLRVWHEENPKKKTTKPKTRLRNFFKNARERINERREVKAKETASRKQPERSYSIFGERDPNEEPAYHEFMREEAERKEKEERERHEELDRLVREDELQGVREIQR